jgi:hypothetical protein
MIALGFPGPFEILILLVLIAVPAAVVLLVLRGKPQRRERPAFPIVPTAEADGPGKYRVVGVDKNTRADREMTVEAASRANARVKAELEGLIVTAVTKQT